MIDTAMRLYRRVGYQATSWRGLVEAAGTPWGSAYHFFPGGKEELACATLDYAARLNARLLELTFAHAASPADAVLAWLSATAETMAHGGFAEGCPVAGVAVDAAPSSPVLTAACRAAFACTLDTVRAGLMRGGIGEARAAELATFIYSSFEGALVLARVQESKEPLLIAGRELARLLREELATPKAPRPKRSR